MQTLFFFFSADISSVMFHHSSLLPHCFKFILRISFSSSTFSVAFSPNALWIPTLQACSVTKLYAWALADEQMGREEMISLTSHMISRDTPSLTSFCYFSFSEDGSVTQRYHIQLLWRHQVLKKSELRRQRQNSKQTAT